MEEQRGGPQEMAFVSSSAGWFPAKVRAGQAQGRPPTTASLGATCPTLEMSGQVHRVPGVVSVELDALPSTRRTARFPVDHTSQQVSHPPKGRVPREELGTRGRDGGPASVPYQAEWAVAGGTHVHGRVLSWGVAFYFLI